MIEFNTLCLFLIMCTCLCFLICRDKLKEGFYRKRNGHVIERTRKNERSEEKKDL